MLAPDRATMADIDVDTLLEDLQGCFGRSTKRGPPVELSSETPETPSQKHRSRRSCQLWQGEASVDTPEKELQQPRSAAHAAAWQPRPAGATTATECSARCSVQLPTPSPATATATSGAEACAGARGAASRASSPAGATLLRSDGQLHTSPVVNLWRRPLLRAAAPHFAKLGRQARPLVLTTACSGMGAPSVLLRILGIDFLELYSSDPKVAAQHFRRLYGPQAQHHFNDIQEATSSHLTPSYCTIHDRECKLTYQEADLFVAGFPCQPFSSQRSQRYRKSKPPSHPGYPVSEMVVEALRVTRPRAALLENVMGMSHQDSEDGGSELQSFLDKVASTNMYHISVLRVSLGAWVRAERQRRGTRLSPDDDLQVSADAQLRRTHP